MTYDPDRNTQNAPGLNPKPQVVTPQKGMGPILWIAIAAVLAVVTMLMFNMGRSDNVAATNDRPVTNAPATTGAGATDPAPAIRDRATGANAPAQNVPAPAPR